MKIDNSKKSTKWENISVWENFLGLGKATGKGEGGLIDVYFLGGGKSYQKRMGAHFSGRGCEPHRSYNFAVYILDDYLTILNTAWT